MELKSPEDENHATRLGTEEEYETIFSTKVPKVSIFVKPGRNIASLVEVAAYNWRLKTMGKNAALEFAERLEHLVRKDK